MEIKLITTNVTTSGGGVGFRFLGNVEIAKPKPTIFGTTTKPKQTVGFRFNNVETQVNSNDEGYFEVYRDSDEPITKFKTNTNKEKLKTLDLSNLDTSRVTDMWTMFKGCSGLTSLDLSNWDTSKVTDMTGMFSGCSGLTSLDVSKWNTSQVTSMQSMFNSCNGLTSLDLSNWNTSKVGSMWAMFENCSSLTSLNLSNWDTSKVTDMKEMFNYCTSLTSLDLSNWDLSKVTNMQWIFHGCPLLKTIKINKYSSASKLIKQINDESYNQYYASWDQTTKIITIYI